MTKFLYWPPEKLGYDYIALGNQLGDNWVDNEYKNDSCPKFSWSPDQYDWYDLWFDYTNVEDSEYPEERKKGTMKLFTITDQFGQEIFASDNWEEVREYVVSGKLREHYDNKQERRATDV